MRTAYWLVKSGECLGTLATGDYVVPVDDFSEPPTDDILLNAADNPGLAVIPLIEQLEHEPDFANLPDFDLVEQLGFDGTGHDEPNGFVSWEQVARRLLELRAMWLKPTEVHVNHAIIERLTELQNQVDDDDDTMTGATITVDGINLTVGTHSV